MWHSSAPVVGCSPRRPVVLTPRQLCTSAGKKNMQSVKKKKITGESWHCEAPGQPPRQSVFLPSHCERSIKGGCWGGVIMLCGKMAPLMMSCIRHKWETCAECSTEAGIPRVIVTAFYEKKKKKPKPVSLQRCRPPPVLSQIIWM